MNGVHDMGGMMGFGPVVSEPNEPVFHAAWEGRAMAMKITVNTGGWIFTSAWSLWLVIELPFLEIRLTQ